MRDSAIRYRLLSVLALMCAATCGGCYAPLRSPGVPANTLPEHYRLPTRTMRPPLDYSSLSTPRPADYVLGADDVLELVIPSLYEGAEQRPITTRVMQDGTVSLPVIGDVKVAELTLGQARSRITQAYANGVLVQPAISLALAEKGTVDVVVLGEVKLPGVYELPRYQHDVAHAIAAAGGLTEESAESVEVHRRPMLPKPEQENIVPPAPKNIQPTNLTTSPTLRPRRQSLLPGPSPQHPQGAPRLYPSQSAVSPAMQEQDRSQQRSEGPPILFTPPGVKRPSPPPHIVPPQIQTVAYHTSSDCDSCDPGPAQALNPYACSIPAPCVATSSPCCVGAPANDCLTGCGSGFPVEHFSLRGMMYGCMHDGQLLGDATLRSGDVVVVPKRPKDVFYVVGRLSNVNRARFTIGEAHRDVGNGFLLPQDREIDVVTAVAMAGYIDPIDSPTTVSVHRIRPDGHPIIISVDLIKARYDRRETIYVQPGDIIYLNPDVHWWFRRLFDDILIQAIGTGIGVAIGDAATN